VITGVYPTRRDRAVTQASEMPIDELGRRAREDSTWAAFSGLHGREEVRCIAELWCRSVGLKARPLGVYSRDAATRAILEAYADGYTREQLELACAQAGKDPWCRGDVAERDGRPGSKRGPECMSPVVLRRLLDAADATRPSSVNPRVAAMLEEERRRQGAGT
jgi:hypothetical protein